MQLSSKNIIKGNRIITKGDFVVETKRNIEKYDLSALAECGCTDEQSFMENTHGLNSDAYGLAAEIIEEASNKAKEIQDNAYRETEEIKKLAQEQGFNEGYNAGNQQGCEAGYNEGYNAALEKIKEEERIVLENAGNILNQAKEYYANYLDEKSDEIKSTIMEICKKILKREVENEGAVNNMILDALTTIKDSSKVIIKCSRNHVEAVNEKIPDWKKTLVYKAEFFVIEDNSLHNGTAVIEKDNGKIVVDINYGLEKIMDSLKAE